MRFSLLIFFLVCTQILAAQNGINSTGGARSLGMADTNLGLRGIDAAFGNQAGLAFTEKLSAIATGQRRFALNELSTVGIGIAYPTGSGTFALQAQYFGFESFNEQKIGLAYARKLGKKFALGAQISYLSTRIAQYENSGLPVFEIGLQSAISKSLTLSAHLINPVAPEITEDEPLPTTLRIGLTYRPSDKLLLSAQADKDVDFAARFRSGIEYSVSSLLYLRAGLATNPSLISFGFGAKLENGLGLDIGAAAHQVLGFMPGIGLRFN